MLRTIITILWFMLFITALSAFTIVGMLITFGLLSATWLTSWLILCPIMHYTIRQICMDDTTREFEANIKLNKKTKLLYRRR